MSDDLLDKILSDESPVEESSEQFEQENLILEPLLPEINMIEDQSIRSFVRAMLLEADDFWFIPSSFSGKHHPPDERLSGGNVVHTKRVARIASFMCESYQRLSFERDIVLAAALLHDLTKGCQRADGGWHTDPMHPYTVEHVYTRRLKVEKQATAEDLLMGNSLVSICDEEIVEHIFRLIRCHLGPWSPVPETYPMTSMEWALHLADMIGANLHKIIDDEDDIKPWRWISTSPPFGGDDIDGLSE